MTSETFPIPIRTISTFDFRMTKRQRHYYIPATILRKFMSLMNTADCNSEHIVPRYAIWGRATYVHTTHVNHACRRGCIRSECTFVCNRPQKGFFRRGRKFAGPARSSSGSLPSRTGFKIRAAQQQQHNHGRMAGEKTHRYT